ncbi:MAG: tetratricopeptide repeat protein [Fimbriimonadaceae bacterium]
MAALTLLCLSAFVSSQLREEEIRWYVSLEYAKRLSRQRGAPILVHFEAQGDLRDGGPEVLFGPATKAMIRNFVPVRLQIRGDGAALAVKYRLPRAGRMIVLDSNEKLIARSAGVQNPGSVLFELSRALRSYRERSAVKKALAKNPNDVTGLLVEATAKALGAQPSQALPLIDKAARLRPKLDHPGFSDAYAAIGDYYQAERMYDAAIPYFRKAKTSARTPGQTAYALISIGSCYLQSDRPKLARPVFEQVLKMKSVSASDADTARRLISSSGRRFNAIPR